jgi:hypothetical protein
VLKNYFFTHIYIYSDIFKSAKSTNKILEIHIAENKETTIHKPSINQKPLIIFIPNMYKIIATITHVTCESHIADHDSLNHIAVDSCNVFHCFNSSFTLSKIRILASIAIPMDKINQAIEAKVNTTQNNLIIVNTIAIYISNATADITQASL